MAFEAPSCFDYTAARLEEGQECQGRDPGYQDSDGKAGAGLEEAGRKQDELEEGRAQECPHPGLPAPPEYEDNQGCEKTVKSSAKETEK